MKVLKHLFCVHFLPLHLFIQDDTIGSILCCKGGATILHAEHDQWFCAIIADGTLAIWCDSYHTSFGNGEHLAVHLKLALATEEEIQLLMGLVGVKETCLGTWGERLEGEFTTSCTNQCASEYLAWYLDLWSKFQYILVQVAQLTEIHGCYILSLDNHLCLFHCH